MGESNSKNENKDSGKSSTKRLVRILVIVGIGIPVLVELLTLFNLINIQLLNGEDEPPITSSHQETEMRDFTEGDTLYSDFEIPVLIRELKVKVSARQWRLNMHLAPADTPDTFPLKKVNEFLSLDSLQLKSGTVLRNDQLTGFETLERGNETAFDYKIDMKLPSGDIPRVLYLTSFQPANADTLKAISRKIRLGNIPIRYEQLQE